MNMELTSNVQLRRLLWSFVNAVPSFILRRQRHNNHCFSVVMKWVLHTIVKAILMDKWMS